MDLNPIDIAIHLVNFLLLFILLRILLYKPVNNFLQKRNETIKGQLADAAASQEEAAKHKAEYEARLMDADKEAQELSIKITELADQTSADIIATARSEAEKILADARLKAEAERSETLLALKGQIAEMSVALAGDILKREVTQADNAKTVDAFFAKAR